MVTRFSRRLKEIFSGSRAFWLGIGAAVLSFISIIFLVLSAVTYTMQIRDRDAQIEGLQNQVAEMQRDLVVESQAHNNCLEAAENYRMAGIAFAEATKKFLLDPSKGLDLVKANDYVDAAKSSGCKG